MKLFLFSLSLILGGAARAELDVHQKNGLAETKRLLTTPAERDKAVQADPAARAADAKIESLVGSGALKETTYGISSDITEKLINETGGDPTKTQEILNEAMKNPEAFYNRYFDDTAKAKVRGVAGAINQPTTAPPR